MKSELEIVAADGARKLVVVAHKPYVIDELDVRVVRSITVFGSSRCSKVICCTSMAKTCCARNCRRASSS
ncbi:MAG TPA: hypothetical protein EYP98_22080 [Planctomycetes bacterium]|nr:hypothetical protein [Planctomycetota bacterium]